MMYNVPTDGCNLEIMGYPFFAEEVSPNEAFRRREFNFNSLVGGTQKVTKGAYIGLDFSVVTHVFIDPDRPDEHNAIFQEMMSKPVEVVSPDLGGRFNAVVVIKPEREGVNTLKLTISVKEIPDKNSAIPGEEFTVPATKQVKSKKTQSAKNSNASKNVLNAIKDKELRALAEQAINGLSKKNTVLKKNKSGK